MVDVTAARTIPAPPEAIWPLLDDPARLGEWFAFADRGEVLEGAGVGRRQRMHGHWGRKRSEIDQVVVEHDPPRRIAWRHEAERLDGKPAPRFAASTRFTMTLEPEGAGASRLTLHSEQEPASALRGLVIRLFGRREVAQRLEESLDRIEAAPHVT
ncbi:MAG: hypothetical protein QOH72_209 [Solirubrobacteraceae bacterium]|jgi:uncharacterized protein YndB with AHSA1/START domain|nr:hypothetical protein [Solirubrobacteraceae bacterium]